MSNRIKMKPGPVRRSTELENFVNGTMAELLDCTLEKFLQPSSFVQQTMSKIWDVAELMDNDVYMQSIRLMLLGVISGELTQSVLPQLLEEVRSKAQQVLRLNGGAPLDSTLDSILSSTREGYLKVLDLNSQEMLHRVTLTVAEQKYGRVKFRHALRAWKDIE